MDAALPLSVGLISDFCRRWCALCSGPCTFACRSERAQDTMDSFHGIHEVNHAVRLASRYRPHPCCILLLWCALCRYKFALDARWRTLLQLVCSLPRHSARRALSLRLALEWLCLSCRMCVRNETSKASPCILMPAQRDPACATTACRDSKIHDRRVMLAGRE